MTTRFSALGNRDLQTTDCASASDQQVIFLAISLEMNTRYCIDGIDFSVSGMLCRAYSAVAKS